MTIELRLAGRPESVARARRAIEQLQPPVSAAQREDLRLLVSEVVTNAIRHAGGGAPGSEVRVRLSTTAERIRVEVFDAGPGFTAPDTDPDPETAGGWGLWLVEQLADRWGIRGQGGTCVWFELAHR